MKQGPRLQRKLDGFRVLGLFGLMAAGCGDSSHTPGPGMTDVGRMTDQEQGAIPGDGDDGSQATFEAQEADGGLDGSVHVAIRTASPDSAASGTCTLGAGEVASWNAETRTFTAWGTYYVLNEQGLVAQKGQINDSRWRHEMTYDGHNTLVSFTYVWEEQAIPANSWNQANSYDATHRLRSSILSFQDINGHGEYHHYVYTGEELTSVARTYVPDAQTDPSPPTVTRFFYEDGQIREVTREGGGSVYNRQLAFYDSEGRLTRLDSDGHGIAPHPDGNADIRVEWSYDAEGNCVRRTQDGTEVLDAPFVDGVPDEDVAFDVSCADIAVLPRELYRFPEWYELP